MGDGRRVRRHRRVFLAVRFSMLPLPAGYSPAATRYAAKELLVRPFATLNVPFRVDETLRHPALGILSAASVVLLFAFGAGRNGWRDRASARAAAATGMVLGAVAPVLAYFYVDPDLLGSRYLYLALSGWVLMLTTSASTLSSRAHRTVAPLACLIVFWIPATRSHLLLWQNAAAARDRILAAAAQASIPTARAGSYPDCRPRSTACRSSSTASRKQRVRRSASRSTWRRRHWPAGSVA